jgi:hypothetical protein
VSKSKQLVGLMFAGIACAALPAVSPALGTEPPEAVRIVMKAKADAVAIPAQAEALVRLAWFDEQENSQAAALARDELVKFGKNGLRALFDSLTEVDIRYTADIVATLIASRKRMITGSPTKYIATLEQAIWFGSVDAKRLAIKEITRFKYSPALLPIMDSAIEHPTLTGIVIDSLSKMGNDRARFFLDGQLRGGDPVIRARAAECLSSIGNNAIQTLREATSSEDVGVRHAAIEALLPRTTLNDLTILHEYIYMHPEDDPRILGLVRDRAILLESMMEQGEESDLFSPSAE